MNRHVRYEVLQNEDPDEVIERPEREEPAIPATMVLVEEETIDTPAADAAAGEAAAAPAANSSEGHTNAGADFKIPEPPSYNIATALPSYEEAERTKLEQEEQARREEEQIGTTDSNSTSGSAGGSANGAPIDPLLGTDGMFLLTFMVSFIFNWIGLLASQCLSQSVAGRLGSMAGFGLSLVKWVAILKHNNWIHGVADSDSWLWWLLILLGFLIFFRGCTQYIRIKHQWHRLSQNVRNNIFYYF